MISISRTSSPRLLPLDQATLQHHPAALWGANASSSSSSPRVSSLSALTLAVGPRSCASARPATRRAAASMLSTRSRRQVPAGTPSQFGEALALRRRLRIEASLLPTPLCPRRRRGGAVRVQRRGLHQRVQ